jgi:hypothetical protein
VWDALPQIFGEVVPQIGSFTINQSERDETRSRAGGHLDVLTSTRADRADREAERSDRRRDPSDRRRDPSDRRRDPSDRLSHRTDRPSDSTDREADPSDRELNRSDRRSDPSGRVHDPSGRVHDPSGRVHDPTGRVHDPTGRVHDPTGRVHDPSGRVHDPSGRVHDPSGRVHDPSGRVHDPTGRRSSRRSDYAANAKRLDPCLEVRNGAWRRSTLSKDKLRMVCEFEAPDAESVREACRTAGVAFERVWTADVYAVEDYPDMMKEAHLGAREGRAQGSRRLTVGPGHALRNRLDPS